MVSMYLLIPLSLMLFVIGIWAVRYAVKSNQFEDLDNESQRVILDDRQERRQTLAGMSNPIQPAVKKPQQTADDRSSHLDNGPDNPSLDSDVGGSSSDSGGADG
ncbi:cbb3-type cytochrome oxidase assembly protein CcoS [Psychrobacter sp. FDAARGOS_221]|uniref:cbb3-type cytochrome oxidase assembly protein CcoS n=1 Tax=Psychrobacter sp. FDAARGOS_221 TaxID=1975705 RepID=UPI000BB572A2|nr:cbb3-type cytochrome oxidase assembly protein CcoS [Psychrobacter sp. FDAARGOS_221]PNK61544.1 cbb3-type cytochrome oxidase assembly protein CcoS [Psychrobacter sp. FDAARGOS_221]